MQDLIVNYNKYFFYIIFNYIMKTFKNFHSSYKKRIPRKFKKRVHLKSKKKYSNRLYKMKGG